MINFKENEDLATLNHSCAHMMAHAIKHLYPQAKFWVGPVVEEGFYYDIDLGDATITDEDLPKIEKEMKKIAKDGKRIVRHEITKEEALEQAIPEMSKIMLAEDVLGLPFFNDAKVGTSYGNSEKYVIKQSN